MDNQEELEQIETTELRMKAEAYDRLKNGNDQGAKDFKTLILDGYLKDRAIDHTSLLSTEYGRSIRSTLFEELAAISCFEGYLHMVENLGAAAAEDDE